MFSINEIKQQMQGKTPIINEKKKNKLPPNIYSNLYASSTFTETNELNTSLIDRILENEKQNNKKETWNKLNKTVKIQKLCFFSEKYGKEKELTEIEINVLKTFFIDCLEKNKLQKSKDLLYNKETQEIISIPSLHFNTELHNFTLKNLDKRVSTLKSLTPKRTLQPQITIDNSSSTIPILNVLIPPPTTP
jgi:hypothetical protein